MPEWTRRTLLHVSFRAVSGDGHERLLYIIHASRTHVYSDVSEQISGKEKFTILQNSLSYGRVIKPLRAAVGARSPPPEHGRGNPAPTEMTS